MKNFFPLVLDNTQISAFKECEIRFFRNYIQHLQSEESTDLIAGRAFAHGIHKTREAYYEQGIDESDAIAIGIEALIEDYGDHTNNFKEGKSVNRMALALESYFTEYDLQYDEVQPLKLENGGYSIEYSLLSPILDFDGNPILHPILELPLLYSGRLDMLASYLGGVFMVDEKTTGSYFTKTWEDQWQTRGQFTGYSWLGKQSGIPELANIAGAIVRGISLPSSTSQNEDTKNKFYSNIENIKHRQCVTTRNDYEIECWHRDMVNTVLQMRDNYIRYLDNNEQEPERFFSGNWGSSCTSYGRGCQFLETCKSRNGEKFLETAYEQHIWLPEEHRREKLDIYLENLSKALAGEVE